MDDNEFNSLVKVIIQIQKDIKEIKNTLSRIEQYFENSDDNINQAEEQLSAISSQIAAIERKERIRDGHGTQKDHEIERMELEYKARNGIFNQY